MVEADVFKIDMFHYDKLMEHDLFDTWFMSHPIMAGYINIVCDGSIYQLTSIGVLFIVTGIHPENPSGYTREMVDAIIGERMNALLSKIEDTLEVCIEDFTMHQFMYK